MSPDDRALLAIVHATLGAAPRDAEGRDVVDDAADDDTDETSSGALHPAQTSGV